MKQPTLPLVSRVRLKSLSHSMADEGTNSEKSASFPHHQEETKAGVKPSPRFAFPQEGGGPEGVNKAGGKPSPRFAPSHEGGGPEGVTKAGVKSSPRFVSPHEGGGRKK